MDDFQDLMGNWELSCRNISRKISIKIRSVAYNVKLLTNQEIRSMERVSAQCGAFRMPKQVVLY